MEQELASYIARQKLKGISETEIRSALIGSQWPIELIDRLLSTKPIIEPPPTYQVKAENIDTKPVVAVQPSPTSHVSTSQALLVIGVALIVIAAIAIITNSWPQLPPMLRFLVIAAPNVALFFVSYFVKDKDRLEHVIDGTRAAGLLILPATIGTFLYQFQLYQTIDSLLFFYSTTLALPFYLYGDIYRRQNYLADLTLINMLAAVLFLGQYLQWSQLSWEIAGLITGSIALGIAFAAAQHNDSAHRRSYEVVSGVLLFFVIPLLVGEIFNLWGSDSATQSSDISLWVIWAIITGFIQLVVASFYGWLFKPSTEVEYSLQRFLQFGAMFCLFVPLIWASGEEVGFLIPTVVISGLVILLAMITSVNLLFISGVIGFVISLLFFLLKQVALEQLITLLILGFSAIGLSIMVGKLRFARQVIFSATHAESLGIISDQAAQKLHPDITYSSPSQASPQRQVRWWLIILLILVGLWAVPALLFAIFDALS